MKTPRLIEIDGFRLPPTFDPEIFREACKFSPSRDQIVVATFPKCGTTWTLQVVGLILRKGEPPTDAGEYFSMFPFLEMTSLDYLQNFRNGCIKTHLPFDRIAFSKDAKYIYVARHPADCAFSFYHHTRYFPVYCFSDGTFDEFFETFISGTNDFGDYFDHLLSWYERRNEPNVFFTTFNELKTDPKQMILKMAKFLGEQHYQSLVENDGEILKKVLEYSSFEYMKNTVDKYWEVTFAHLPPEEIQKQSFVMKNYAEHFAAAAKNGHHPIGNFVRKGEIGEGKLTLSGDQKRRLKDRIKEKCGHSDVMNLLKRL